MAKIDYEIIDVKRRNILARIVSISHYKVTVKLGTGKILKLNGWAGVFSNTPDNLIGDIEQSLEKKLCPKLKKPTWRDVLTAKGAKGTIEGVER